MPKLKKSPCSVTALIASLVLEPLPRGELTRRAEEIAARHYEIPGSKRTSVCVDILLGWVLRYRSGGFEALPPKPRQDRGQPRTITPQFADLIERLKRENPHRTGTTLLLELALSSGQNEPAISASTLCLTGQTIEVRFDPLDAASVEIYFHGQPQGIARLVDPVVNAQLPSAKSSPAAEPEPTGINFIDLLIQKQDKEEPPW
jgi:hypothetical protein